MKEDDGEKRLKSYQRQYSIVSNLDDENTPPSASEKLFGLLTYIKDRSPIDPSLLLAIVVLIVSTAAERISFKVMVDSMLPYKFVLVDIIFLLTCFIFSTITFYKKHFTHEITANMASFPHRIIMIIAFFDSLQFMTAVYSAGGVSPTMTVILMHASTLFVVLGSKVAFPSRNYGFLHKVGVALISLAIIIALFKIIWNDYYYYADSQFETTKASFLYLVSSALHGLSTLLKERALVDWSQPINIYFLSSWLFLYQFLFAVLLSVVFYTCEGKFI
jgi:hypothetical protein